MFLQFSRYPSTLMIGPKLAKKLHCFLTDREVHFEMDPNAAVLHTQYDPTAYDCGMRCNYQAECQKREIKCQVFDPDGRFPFNDEEVLNLQSTVLNFRNMAQARLENFRTWSVGELANAIAQTDPGTRREIAFYLRFRQDAPADLWPTVELLLDVDNRLNDHSARIEAIESVAIWIAQDRPVPRPQFRAMLEQLAAADHPVARQAGERFTAALQAFLADL